MHSGKWVKMLKELGFIPGRPKSARVPGPKGAAATGRWYSLGSGSQRHPLEWITGGPRKWADRKMA